MTGAGWAMVPLGEVLHPAFDPHAVDPVASYPIAGVYGFGRGMIKRPPTTGQEIAATQLFRIKSGQFIYSRLKSFEGAFAVVSDDVDGYFVSNEFPTFDASPSRLDPRYLGWYFKQKHVWQALASDNKGIGARRERLHPDRLLDYEFPLPPLDEQRRIVARIDALAAKIAEARGLREEASSALTALRASGQHRWFATTEERCSLGDVCLVIDPNPSHRYPEYVLDGIPMITTSDFEGDDHVRIDNAKHVTRAFFDETLGRFGIGNGDVIFARKGKVGYARPYPSGLDLAMTHTLCVLKPDRTRLAPSFLLHFARSAGFLDYLQGTMNPNLGVPTLGLNVIREAPMPLPTLGEQRRIVAELDALQAKVDAVKTLHAETAAELDALLPAILDRAFKGEL